MKKIITILGLVTISLSAQAHVCKVASIRAAALEKDDKLLEVTTATLECNKGADRITAIVRSQAQVVVLNAVLGTSELVRIGVDAEKNLTEASRNIEGF